MMPFSRCPNKLLCFGSGIQLLQQLLQVMDLGRLRNVPLDPSQQSHKLLQQFFLQAP